MALLKTAWVAASICIAMPVATSRADPMTFRVASAGSSDGSSWIVADGDIVSSTPDEFQTFLDNNNMQPQRFTGTDHGAKEIWLNSPGGSLSGGMQLGRIIRKYGLATYVARSIITNAPFEADAPGKCASACSFSFLGGVSRKAPDQTIGVHQFRYTDSASQLDARPYKWSDISDVQRTVALESAYVIEMGIDGRFLSAAANTEPSDIHFLTTDEMTQFGVNYDPLVYKDWYLEPYKAGLVAVSKSQTGDKVATIYCRRSKAMHLRIVMPYNAGYASASEIIKASSVSLFGKEIQATDITGKITQGQLDWDIKLPDGLDLLSEADLQQGLSGAGVTRSFFDHSLPTKDFAVYASLVKRNCF